MQRNNPYSKTNNQNNSLPSASHNDVVISADQANTIQFFAFLLLQRAYQQKNPILFDERSPTTFMGSAVYDIPIERVLMLDGKVEDADEILQLMKAHEKSGKNIFQNPNTETNNTYSDEAISKIKQHPICREFIIGYEKRQQDISKVQLPEAFYHALHQYVLELYRHGLSENGQKWGYMTSSGQENNVKLLACLDAKERFLKTIKTVCSTNEQKALDQKIITLRLRGGTDASAAQAKFSRVLHGEASFDCIITQQIYLWGMLREKHPELIPPEHLRTNRQAAVFNLGGPEPAQHHSRLSIDELLMMININQIIQEITELPASFLNGQQRTFTAQRDNSHFFFFNASSQSNNNHNNHQPPSNHGGPQ
tara:strand:+ start:228 stop:1325 length:1098 start_codon:yes stop_codon:yes gene_type:complete